MENINPYNPIKFKKEFRNTDIYNKLLSQYDIVNFDKFFEVYWKNSCTPREQLALKYTSATTWYYLQYLDPNGLIYDLGCGRNLFKSYFPNLIGIDADLESSRFFGDIQCVVDDNFFTNHKNYFQSVFSINALHFHPLEKLKSIAIDFSSMLKLGGRGFLTLNYPRMQERSSMFQHGNVDIKEVEHWIRGQFENFPCKILVLDVDLRCLEAWLDGNIRIVFEQG